MEYKTLFNLCWDSSETLFLVLSKNLSIINSNSAVEVILNYPKVKLLNKKMSIIFENCEQDFPKKISFSKKTKITALYGLEKFKIQWEIIPLGKDKKKDAPAFFVIGKINNNLIEKQQEILSFEALIKYAPGMFYWKNKEGVYEGCNDEFAKLADLPSRFDVVGKTDYKLPWRNRAASYTKIDKEVFLTQKPDLNREETVTIANGESITMITNKVPLFNKQNELVGLVGITVDITHQKKIEQDLQIAIQKLAAANKVKTEFLENMRHDIRTPLVGITGFAEIIKNEATDPKIKEYAENLIISSYSLLDLLNGVLESIKVSSGEIPLLKKKFNLKNKLNEVISLNQSKANQKKVALLLEHDSSISEYLVGDPIRIHRVILELVTNALNFTHKGQVKLSTQLERNYKNAVVIKIIVADTGIGIHPDRQQDIYVQFKRLTPSYEGIYKGTGLGLSIAKKFMDDLQGELYVESELGVGSTFTCVLKLKKPLLNDALGSESLIPSRHSNQAIPVTGVHSFKSLLSNEIEESKNNVLLVEDNDIAARVVATMLSTMHCKVDVVNKGKLAVQFAEKNQYDLIFMDIGLPDIDGYQVTKRIRLNELNKEHVPIVALTGHVDEEGKRYCISIGMNAVFPKPLRKENAEDILKSFIAHRKDKSIAGDTSVFLKNRVKIESPVLDFELIEKQFSKKIAIKMLGMLMDSLPKELAILNSTYKKNDWVSIRNLVHRLKGGVSYCGTMRLGAACSELDLSIRNGENELFEDLYHQLINEIAQAEKAIKEKLSERLES